MNGGYIELVNGDYKLTNVTGGAPACFLNLNTLNSEAVFEESMANNIKSLLKVRGLL